MCITWIDVLSLTELWHDQVKFQTKDTSFTIEEPKLIKKGKRKGKVRFLNDGAANVTIMSSKRVQQKIDMHVPHGVRVTPCQDDTLRDLEVVLRRVSRGDCMMTLGDFNDQLEGEIQNRTDKWVGGFKLRNADKIM